MAIVKASQLDFTNKKLSILIYGVPSIGKTTLGLSAPKPLLVDLDKGISRVEPKYRVDTTVVETFEELKKDLTSNDLSAYESIVIDTGGALLDILKPYVMKQEPKNATKGGALSLAGYGAIAREFRDFTDFVKGLNKHIVFIFHASEDKDQDNVTYRLSAEGSTKTKIWESIDLGGFMEVIGRERTINFSANSRSFAKGNNDVNGSYKVPTLSDETNNTFLADLITMYLNKLNQQTEKLNAENEAYDRAMKYADVIGGVDSIDGVNEAYEGLKKVKHALTSKRELFTMLVNEAKQLNLRYSKTDDKFIEVETETKE